MVPAHVLQAVDERLALNALADVPVSARLLVDFAQQGTCGQRAEDRRAKALAVAMVRDQTTDRAAHDALDDLHYVLQHATDDEGSQEDCARAVAAAWRAESPFRRDRGGDMYDVFMPHASDGEAVAALDRARRLPGVPSRAMMESARAGRHAVECMWKRGTWVKPIECATGPFDPAVAKTLLAGAEAAVRELQPLLAQEPSGGGEYNLYRVEAAVQKSIGWAHMGGRHYSEPLFMQVAGITATGGPSKRANDGADGIQSILHRDDDDPSVRRLRRIASLFREIEEALYYVQVYNRLHEGLEDVQDDMHREVERLRTLKSKPARKKAEAVLARLNDERDQIRALLPQLDEEAT